MNKIYALLNYEKFNFESNINQKGCIIAEKEFLEKIERLEKRLKAITRDKKVELEDQLFFGLIVSLALFVITLPLTDVIALFQATLRINYTTASNLAQSIKNFSMVCLLSSALLRYYASLKPHKGARLVSFLLLWAALDFFLFQFTPMLSFYFEQETRLIVFILSYFALFLVYILMGKVESNAIMFYAKRGFVLKKYSKPIVSFFFAIISGSTYISLAIQLTWLFVYHTFLSDFQIFIIWMLVAGLFGSLGYLRFLKRMKLIR